MSSVVIPEFVAMLVHDLKAPLSAIQLSTNLLLDEKVGTLQPQQQRLVEILAKSGNRITRLVDDLLDVYRLASGTTIAIRPSTDSCDALVSEASSEIAPVASEKRVALETDWPGTLPQVRVDRRRIVQMLDTLLTLLMKYVKTDSTIRMGASANGERVMVSVQGSMAGTHADTVKAILDGRLADRVSLVGARLDLGLTLAAACAVGHGGSLDCETAENAVVIRFSVPSV